ncbi:polysaccharide biosynthesis/export family protein [Mucilaginibacter sp.]
MRVFNGVHFIVLFLTGVLLLSACATRQHQLLFQSSTPTADSAAIAPPGPVSYHILPQDLLQVRNLQSLSAISGEVTNTGGGQTTAAVQTYQVEEDGTVALPAVGHVKVAGLTRFEAEKQIEALYRKTLLRDPIIELKITNLKVTLLGEVRAQGNYPLLKEQTTLVDMIGAAGGLTDRANEKNIKIIRGDKMHPQIILLDLSNLKTLADPRILLQNNDIVYVAQSRRATSTENLQYISTLVQPALLLINTALLIISFSR